MPRTAAEIKSEIAALRARYKPLKAEVDEIVALGGDATDGELVRAARQANAARKIAEEIKELQDEQREAVRALASNPRNRDGVQQVARVRSQEMGEAHRTIETISRSGMLPDHGAEKATALLEQGPMMERALASQWVHAFGDPEYLGAFAKLCADPNRGHLMWTPQEADAYRTAKAVDTMLQRAAMDTSSANGAEMIPLTLDPAILLTNDGSNNPLRRLASVKQTMTNTWQGVTSAGATSEWKTEGSEAADGSPTLASPSIPVFLGDTYVVYSYEIGMDALNFLQELQAVMIDSADNLMATAYTTGNGSTAPQGIITGLAGTSSEINTTGTEALDDSDPFALQNALPARFSAGAVFMSHIATANTYRQMETTNGALQFPELRQDPPRLLGKPWYENSNMDGSINAAATANNYLLVYGDIRRGFYIVDRVGTRIEFIQNVVGANGRPTGQRGAFLYFRTGSEVVLPQALRLLDVPTTA